MGSEEIFDFSKNSITSMKAKELKNAMTAEFGSIFELCEFVIDMHLTNPGSIKPSLVKVTLKTFSAFMSWIPLGYIFETTMISKLIQNLLHESSYRVETIKCLTEFAGLRGQGPLGNSAYEETALMLFISIIDQMNRIIMGVDLAEEYRRIDQKKQSGYESFCLQYSLLLITFLLNHIDLIENVSSAPTANKELVQVLLTRSKEALLYIYQLSNIPNEEIFKVCCEFWNALASRVYNKTANEISSTPAMTQGMSPPITR